MIVQRPVLPLPPPELASPVPLPVPRAGQDALALAARTRFAAKQANKRIIAFEEWYARVREEYGDAER